MPGRNDQRFKDSSKTLPGCWVHCFDAGMGKLLTRDGIGASVVGAVWIPCRVPMATAEPTTVGLKSPDDERKAGNTASGDPVPEQAECPERRRDSLQFHRFAKLRDRRRPAE